MTAAPFSSKYRLSRAPKSRHGLFSIHGRRDGKALDNPMLQPARVAGRSQLGSVSLFRVEADAPSLDAPVHPRRWRAASPMCSAGASYLTGQLIVIDGGNSVMENKGH